MAIDALDAGKHVSVQKPMALSVADADAMIDAAQRSGKMLRVIENYRYYAPIREAKRLLDDGAIGEPLSIRIKSLTGNSKHGWGHSHGRSELALRPGAGGRRVDGLRPRPAYLVARHVLHGRRREHVCLHGPRGGRVVPRAPARDPARQPHDGQLEIPGREQVRLVGRPSTRPAWSSPPATTRSTCGWR